MFNFFERRKKNKPKILYSEVFKKYIFQDDRLKIIIVSAHWCDSCRIVKPIFEDLSDENRNNTADWFVVNSDTEHDIVKHFYITSLPTVIFVRSAFILYQGPMIPKMSFQNRIDSLLRN
jgi:thiol-disulfide isomerase/thioredoxin